MKNKTLTPDEIAKIIDPDNTFLDECREVVKEIFNLTDKELNKIEEE